MPYIVVVLKNGTRIPVPDADSAEWTKERAHIPAGHSTADVVRLVCRRGETIVGRFNEDQVAGYTWNDGSVPSPTT